MNYTVTLDKRVNTVIVGVKFKASESWEAMLGIRTHHMDAVDAWVRERNFGRRTSFNMWRLKSPEIVTAFILYWQNKACES